MDEFSYCSLWRTIGNDSAHDVTASSDYEFFASVADAIEYVGKLAGCFSC